MIVLRLRVPLDQTEYQGLIQMADQDLRSSTDQIRFILRQELVRRGLINEQSTAGLQQQKGGNSQNVA